MMQPSCLMPGAQAGTSPLPHRSWTPHSLIWCEAVPEPKTQNPKPQILNHAQAVRMGARIIIRAR